MSLTDAIPNGNYRRCGVKWTVLPAAADVTGSWNWTTEEERRKRRRKQ